LLSVVIGRALVLFLVSVGGNLPISHAAFTTNITSDGTLPTPTTVTPNGKTYDINGGTIKGTNQFHSFGKFSVGTGDTASFNGPAGILNILSRVTGGQSQIDGTIKSTISGANLYLMNPAGVLFGPNATLNLSGSFHVTTADYLRLVDNVQFLAKPDVAKDSLLITAPVAAFGFTNPRPVSISVQNGLLQVPTDQTLSLIAGDITIAGSTLRAASGQINLASVASAGEVIPNAAGQSPSLDVSSFTSLGQITETFFESGPLYVVSNITVSSSLGAGTLVIRAGGMTQDNSFLSAQNLGTVDANTIGLDIHVTGDLILRRISTNLAQTINARGAGIQITAERLVLESTDTRRSAFSGFNSSSFGSGRAGNIVIAADTIEARGNTNIGTNTFASGRGGDIQISADQVILDSLLQGTYLGSSLSSVVQVTGGIGQPGAGTGQGGTVRLNVRDLQLLNGAQILAFTDGNGNGGAIDIQAKNLLISGFNHTSGAPSSLSSTARVPAALGNGGNIQVQADAITVENGGLITTQSAGMGNAGNISIKATDRLVMRDSSVTTQAVQSDGGDITVQAGNLVHLVGSNVTTSVGTGFGNGGNISIDPNFVVLDHSHIVANAFGGKGGNITITSGVFLADPSSIVNASSARGINGTIDIQSPVQNLSGTLSPLPSTLLKIAPLTPQCAARAQGGTFSSFTVAGRDGVPVEPGGLLPSPLQEASQSVTSSTHASSDDAGLPISILLAMNWEGYCGQ
jgi:filamentous hemagglutinin family protein